MAQPTQDAALLMRKLGTVGFAVYCSAKTRPPPRAKWAAQPWLAYNEELAGVPEMQWLDQLDPPQRLLQASDMSTLIRACQAGLGLALLHLLLRRPCRRRRRLARNRSAARHLAAIQATATLRKSVASGWSATGWRRPGRRIAAPWGDKPHAAFYVS